VCACVRGVGARAQVKLAVTFRPLRATTTTQQLTLRFGGVSGAPDTRVVVRGRGVLAPIFAARPVVDMRTLLYGGTRTRTRTHGHAQEHAHTQTRTVRVPRTLSLGAWLPACPPCPLPPSPSPPPFA
jgi:hypothetical protein